MILFYYCYHHYFYFYSSKINFSVFLPLHIQSLSVDSVVQSLMTLTKLCSLQEDAAHQKEISERARRFLDEKKRRDEELKTKMERVCSAIYEI